MSRPADIIRIYTNVGANTTHNEDYTIPAGKEIQIVTFYGNPDESNTRVSVIWDPDTENTLLFSSPVASSQDVDVRLQGDGSKKLRLQLKNSDVINSRTVGGAILGFEYNAS